MFNPHTKFEVSTITCNEEMKGNAKCKNSCFEPPFGGLRGNAQGSSMARWKAHCRLPISDNSTFLASSHGCGTIKRNLSTSEVVRAKRGVMRGSVLLLVGMVAAREFARRSYSSADAVCRITPVRYSN